MDDIRINDDNTPVLKNGDFFIDDATRQNQQLILVTTKGSFKNAPVVGVSAATYLLDGISLDEFKKEIRKQMELDGMRVNELEITGNYQISLDANY